MSRSTIRPSPSTCKPRPGVVRCPDPDRIIFSGGQVQKTFLKTGSIMAKYGKRATNWCWAHRDEILRRIAGGASVTVIVEEIKDRLDL